MNATTESTITFENVTVDLHNFTVSLDGEVTFTVPMGWAPYAQLVGELADMADDGRISRTARRTLINKLDDSSIGRTAAQLRSWQGF